MHTYRVLENLSYKTTEQLIEQIKSIKASYLSLRVHYLGQRSKEDLIRIFKAIPVSVTNLDLCYNDFGSKNEDELTEIFQALFAHNPNLTILGLGNNFLSSKVISILKIRPAHLSELDLSLNEFDSETIKEMVSIVKDDYVLQIIGVKELEVHRSKNEKLAGNFFLLDQAIKKDVFIDNSVLDMILTNLEQIPGFRSKLLAQDSYPREAHRLLMAMKNMNTYGKEERNARILALQCLLPHFKYASYQKFADKALGQLLAKDSDLMFGEEACILKNNSNFLQLYLLKNQMRNPEIRPLIEAAIFKLAFLIYSEGELEEKPVLSLLTFRNLLKKSLIQCRQNDPEYLLLSVLYISRANLDFAIQSPTFLKVFQTHYPKAKFFTTEDHFLFCAAKGDNSFFIGLPKEPISQVTEDQVADFAHQLIQDNVKERVVLSQLVFRGYLSESLKQCKVNDPEYLLIKALLDCRKNFAFAIQSPAFLKVFQSHYPQAKSFTIPQHCLLNAVKGDNCFFLTLPKDPVPQVTKEQVANFALQLVDEDIEVEGFIETSRQVLQDSIPILIENAKSQKLWASISAATQAMFQSAVNTDSKSYEIPDSIVNYLKFAGK